MAELAVIEEFSGAFAAKHWVPTRPLALLSSVVTPPHPLGELRLVFRGIQEDGRLSPPATLKDRGLLETGWSADGQQAYRHGRPLP